MKISKAFSANQRAVIRAAIENSRIGLPMPNLNKIRIHSTKSEHWEGWAYVTDKNDAEISVNRNLHGAALFQCVAHEMVHISQYLRGDLITFGDDRFIWKGKAYKLSDKKFQKMDYKKYRKLPWESEAYEYCERMN